MMKQIKMMENLRNELPSRAYASVPAHGIAPVSGYARVCTTCDCGGGDAHAHIEDIIYDSEVPLSGRDLVLLEEQVTDIIYNALDKE